jgi:hypothetical protein
MKANILDTFEVDVNIDEMVNAGFALLEEDGFFTHSPADVSGEALLQDNVTHDIHGKQIIDVDVKLNAEGELMWE